MDYKNILKNIIKCMGHTYSKGFGSFLATIIVAVIFSAIPLAILTRLGLHKDFAVFLLGPLVLFIAVAGFWGDYQKTLNSIELIEQTKRDIISLLKNKGTKITVSDINAFLKHQNLDEIKQLCEEMYQNGEIDFAGNGRYFILSK